MKGVFRVFAFLFFVFFSFSVEVFGSFSVEREIETFEGSDTIEITLTIRTMRRADIIELPSDIVMSLDASPSMVTSWEFDAFRPARETGALFVESFRGSDARFATFSFDDTVFMESGFTSDVDAAVRGVNSVELFIEPTDEYPEARGSHPQTGTSLARAIIAPIEYAISNFESGRQPVVVVVTDAHSNLDGPPYNTTMAMAEAAVRNFYNTYGGRVFFVSLVEGSPQFAVFDDIVNSYGGATYVSPTPAELEGIFVDITRRINEIAAVNRVVAGADLPMVVEVLPQYLDFVEGSVVAGGENTIANVAESYTVSPIDSLTEINFFIDEFLYTDVFQVSYRARVTDPLLEEVDVVITRDMVDNNFSRMQYVWVSTGRNVTRPAPGGVINIPQRVMSFEIRVDQALFNGVPGSRGDSVSYREGFSIEIVILDENGVPASDISGTRTLSFDWGYGGNTIPAGTVFEFVNGRVVITADAFPFVINNATFNTLTITDATGVRGERTFPVVMPPAPPAFSIDGEPIFYDLNGDGFQDYLTVRFTHAIDTAHFIQNRTSLIRSFSFQADYARSDVISQFFGVVNIEIVDERTIGLVIGISSDTAGRGAVPQTGIEPVLEYSTPGAATSIRGAEYEVFLGNVTAETTERVGMVVNRAFLENIHDGIAGTNRLRLTLSEDIDYGILESVTPFAGIMILRVSDTGFDTLYLPPSAEWFNPRTYQGREVVIGSLEGFNFVDTEVYYVKLIRDSVFVDFYSTDVHIDNPPRILEVQGGYSHVTLVPVPVYRPGVPGSETSGHGVGAVFRIRTNVPLAIDILFTNAHGNVINIFKLEVTEQILQEYGQVRDEMMTVFFGAATDGGNLRVINPDLIDSINFNITTIPERHRWLPVNKNGRIIESGAHIMRMDVRSVAAGTAKSWERNTLVIIVK